MRTRLTPWAIRASWSAGAISPTASTCPGCRRTIPTSWRSGRRAHLRSASRPSCNLQMWFASGAVMIYVPFPSLSHDSVLARTSTVNLQQVTTPPALATLGLPADEIDRVRLIDVNGLPVYVVHPYGAAVVVVNAHDGWLHEQFDAATAK